VNLRQKLISNSFFSALPRLLGITLNFILVPLLIYRLGQELFGVWTVFSAFSSYFLLLDFGIGNAFVKFIAEAKALSNSPRIFQIISTGFWSYVFLAFPIVVAGFFFRAGICSLLNIPNFDSFEIQTTYYCTLLSFFLFLICSILQSSFDGLQEMKLSSYTSLAMSLLNSIGTVFVLYMGYGIVGLAISNLVAIVLGLAVSANFFHALFPNFRLSFFNKTLFKSMISYGSQLQISSLAYTVLIRSETLILSSVVGVVAVGYYRIASAIATLARDIPAMLLPALLPAAAEMNSLKQYDKLKILYEKASSYLVFAAISLNAYCFIYADSIIGFWIQSDNFEASVKIARLLIVAFTFNVLTGVATSMARSISLTKPELIANSLMVVFQIGLNFIFLTHFGVKAIGYASFIVISLIDIILLYVLTKCFDYDFQYLLRKVYLPVCLVTVVSSIASLCVLFLFQTIHLDFLSLRIKLFIFLMLSGISFVGLQLFLGIKFKIIEKSVFLSLARIKF
jgi:O-antigen/teichoic acid export membrane protein